MKQSSATACFEPITVWAIIERNLGSTLSYVPSLPIIEFIILFVFFYQLITMWDNSNINDTERCVSERAHGQAAVLAQLQGIITAAAIVMGSIAAFSAITQSTEVFVKVNVVYASMWAIMSICAAVWTLGIIPYRARTSNVARSREVTFVTVAATLLLLFACLRFGVAIYYGLSVR